MKKITETQLKDKVNSLREYLKVYEDENEIPFDPTWGGTKAPADTRKWYQKLNPFGDGPPQAANKNATWNNKLQAAVSNQPKAPPNLADMDIGFGPGKFAPDDANQAASVTPAAPSTQDLTAAASASGEAVGKSLQRFKELLAKAAAPAAPMAPGEKRTQAEIDHAKSLGSFTGESTTYFLNKLRLIESRQLNETLTDAEKKELDTLAQSFGDSENPEIAELLKQYSDVKNAAMAAPAQAAAVTPAAPAKQTGPVTWKQIYDANKDVIGANPNLIKPGQKLKMPDGSTYTVKAGDNLSKIAKNASGGQAASVTPAAPSSFRGGAPTLTTAQQGFKDYGMAGQEMRSPEEIAASAGLADAPATPDAGLQPSDPRHSGHAAWKAQQAAMTNAADGVNQGVQPGITPGANARDDLLARRAKPVQSVAFQPAQKKMAESVGYNELQRIVSLVNHR